MKSDQFLATTIPLSNNFAFLFLFLFSSIKQIKRICLIFKLNVLIGVVGFFLSHLIFQKFLNHFLKTILAYSVQFTENEYLIIFKKNKPCRFNSQMQ